MILLMVINVIMIFNTNGYQFLFKENSTIDELGAVYLNDIGNTKIFCRNRILELNIEIEDIEKIKKETNMNLKLMIETCNQTKPNQICQIEIEELQAIFQKFLEKNKIINSVKSSRIVRNVEEVENILQKSITLNDMTYNNIRQNVDELREITEQIMKFQSKIIKDIDYINFDMLFSMTISNLERHIKLYETIFDLLIEQDTNKLINIISIDELKLEMERLQLSAGRELCNIPIDLNHYEITKYLKITPVKTQVFKNYILITLHIPTFYKTTYNLIKAVSIPFLYKESSYVLKPIGSRT